MISITSGNKSIPIKVIITPKATLKENWTNLSLFLVKKTIPVPIKINNPKNKVKSIVSIITLTSYR